MNGLEDQDNSWAHLAGKPRLSFPSHRTSCHPWVYSRSTPRAFLRWLPSQSDPLFFSPPCDRNAVVALASLQRVSLPQLISSAITGEACHEEQRGAGSKTREGREQLEEESPKVEGLKEHQVATLLDDVRDDGGGYCFIATICGIIARNNLSIKRDGFRTGRTLRRRFR